jgi:hypothetical protein
MLSKSIDTTFHVDHDTCKPAKRRRESCSDLDAQHKYLPPSGPNGPLDQHSSANNIESHTSSAQTSKPVSERSSSGLHEIAGAKRARSESHPTHEESSSSLPACTPRPRCMKQPRTNPAILLEFQDRPFLRMAQVRLRAFDRGPRSAGLPTACVNARVTCETVSIIIAPTDLCVCVCVFAGG